MHLFGFIIRIYYDARSPERHILVYSSAYVVSNGLQPKVYIEMLINHACNKITIFYCGCWRNARLCKLFFLLGTRGSVACLVPILFRPQY